MYFFFPVNNPQRLDGWFFCLDKRQLCDTGGADGEKPGGSSQRACQTLLSADDFYIHKVTKLRYSSCKSFKKKLLRIPLRPRWLTGRTTFQCGIKQKKPTVCLSDAINYLKPPTSFPNALRCSYLLLHLRTMCLSLWAFGSRHRELGKLTTNTTQPRRKKYRFPFIPLTRIIFSEDRKKNLNPNR